MEEELFKSLKGSKLGKNLVEYFERMEAEIYDSRNWEEGMDAKSAKLAARPIRKFINNVKIQPDHKDAEAVNCE